MQRFSRAWGSALDLQKDLLCLLAWLALVSGVACSDANPVSTEAPGDAAASRSLSAEAKARTAAYGARGDAPGVDVPSLQRAIAAAEYQVSENAHGLQAPNRAHQLRSYFDDKGVRVHDRLSQGEEPLVSLRLTGLQRGDTQLDVGLGEVTSHGTRVEIRRPGLVEWYDNSPAGLEQGFTIEQPLEGDGPLWLDMVVEGASARANGEHVEIATAQGRRLRYGGLVVVDAVGRMLEASLEVPDDSKIRVVLADAGAVYPVTIDPLLTSFPDAFIVSDQANAQVGYDVAGAGDVNGDGYADVIVGAPRYDAGEPEEGVAFVFLGSASGAFISEPIDAHAQLESNQSYSKMGARVASAGDVNGDGYADVIVGAPFYYNGPTGDGAAFVFLGSATGIADADPSTAHARFESKQAISVFGSDVAGAGDVNGDGYGDIIIGAQAYDSGEANEGAAFVFLGSASGLTDGDPGTAHARFEGNQLSAQLGVSVDGAGDVNGDGYADVIVGAETYSAGESGEGAAFIFLGSAAGMVDGDPSTADTQLESNQASAKFGCSVAGAGDVDGDGYADVIVGSSNYDLGQIDEGFAFIFRGSASGIADGGPNDARSWLQSNQNGAWMGSSVAGAGDVNGDGYADVIVGAEQYDGAQIDEGAAFVFMGSPALIADGDPTTGLSLGEIDEAGALVGASVAGAGDVNGDGYADVIAGVYAFDGGGTLTDFGMAVVYHGSALGVVSGGVSTAHATFQSDQVYGHLGDSVASAGDVNGDGYDDVIIGASDFDAGQIGEGVAFVFLGSAVGIASGNPSTAHARLESNQAWTHFGWSVANAGDVNGDGYADVIVGAPSYSASATSDGTAFVFLGSTSGIADGNPSTAHATLESDQLGATFGRSVASAGDVNGDGYADVIVGANLYDAGEASEGAAFVFLGSAVGIASGNPSTAHARLESNQAWTHFGWSVANAGDVNGDGYADVIVGAPSYSASATSDGTAFVFLGSTSGIADGNPSTAHATLESDQLGATFGRSVASAGDVNGDGYADVIVGANLYDAGESFEGAAFVYLGSAAGIADGNPSTAHASLQSNQAGAHFGVGVASAGDVNGDGYSDVIIGANLYDAGEEDEGAVFVFLGSAAGIANGDPSTAHAILESNQAGAFSGQSVASAGDVNGDGYSDVIMGAPLYDAAENDEGAAFIYLGNSEGRPVLATQRRGDPSADCATLPEWTAPEPGVYFFADEADWTAAATAAAGSVEAFDTTPANIAKANEVATPPGQNTWVPPFVTFDRANTGLCPTFTLETLQSGAWFTYDDGEPSPATWPEGYLSIGDINDYEDDDFRITFTENRPYAVGLHLVDNDNTAGETLAISVGGSVVILWIPAVEFPAKSDEGAFVGFVASAPIDSITFDESPDGDDVGLRDLLLAPAGAPLRAAPWTKSGSNDGFSVDILASHPDGTGRVKVEFEACPTGLAFGDPNCTTAVSPSWEAVDGANPEVRIGHTFTGLSLAELYRWRARTLYAAASEAAPIVPQHGPWRRHTAQAREADIRVPEPTVGLLFASGVAGLVALARRRNRRR